VTYATERLDEIDVLPDVRYHYRPVRHHFGITSFGATARVGAAAGDPIINEYDEDSQQPSPTRPGIFGILPRAAGLSTAVPGRSTRNPTTQDFPVR
jgi:hypothetical protein